uniref:Antigen 5-related protein n=1 Tax=Sergentomyia schwetzi TaxID=114605 RepID=A0A6B9VKR5_9DIPT|nr:antigen 5-related protein [Sergentomyia schwetzi]
MGSAVHSFLVVCCIMWKISILCGVFGLFVAVVVSDQSFYCDANSCPSYNPSLPPRKHIGCGNNGGFDHECPSNAEIIPIDEQKQLLFLKLHNRLRDRLARGKVPGFKKAAKMPMLKWNDELAKLAELNVRTCKFEHDECRATKICPYAGQNLAWSASFPDFQDVNYVIKNSTREWFNEYRFANQAHTDRYTTGSGNGGQIGHFTAFIHEKSDKVGCAVVKYSKGEDQYKEYLVACNYCYTNMMFEKIYTTTTGKPCSQCKNKKCGKVYKNLCDKSEEVEPIPDVLKQNRG